MYNIIFITPWTQGVNWVYMSHAQDFLNMALSKPSVCLMSILYAFELCAVSRGKYLFWSQLFYPCSFGQALNQLYKAPSTFLPSFY